jgi:hypothetical protein
MVVQPAMCRWRLHLDVEQSVDAVLGGAPDAGMLGSSSGGSGTMNSSHQNRSRERVAAGDRLVVQSETAEAARQALAAAAAVKSAAGSASGNDAGGMGLIQGAPGGSSADGRLLGGDNDGSCMHCMACSTWLFGWLAS